MSIFEKRQKEKDEKRMSDYKNPDYAKGMEELFKLVREGKIQVPQRARLKF